MHTKMIAAMMTASLAIAAPALADTKPAPGVGGVPAAAPSATTTQRSPTQRYCVVQTITGSLLPIRMCHTRSEWINRGFDPLAAK